MRGCPDAALWAWEFRPSPSILDLESQRMFQHILEVTPGVHASAHDDGIVFLHIATGRVFQSNRIGAAIWRGVSQGRTSDSIAAEIGAEYAVPTDDVARHTASFLAELEQQGFVTRTEQRK
jgi:hypothetical protein